MRMRLGLLRLVDGAAAVLAQARGLFAAEGLEVQISVEPSWATLADRLAWGALDGAIMLPPLALAAAAGLRGATPPLVVPMGISAGGNSVVLAPQAAEAVGTGGGALATGRRLAGWLRAQKLPPRLGVVHAWSSHALLLRYWLAAGGAIPDSDVEFVVVPPERVAGALADGWIIGFCAGAPWGEAVAARGTGRVVLGTSAIWQGHPEKSLAVSAAWAAAEPAALAALLRALLRAGQLCEQPAEAEALALLLAERLDLPQAAARAALPGGAGREQVRFMAGGVWFPWRSQGAWFAGQMRRWGWLPDKADPVALARALYRPDLLEPAARSLGLHWPDADAKPEGGHAFAWSRPASPRPLDLMADVFCDGQHFDKNGDILGDLPVV